MCADKVEREKEKKFIVELIELYRTLNALWDVNSKDYGVRRKKDRQNEILLAKYRERYPQTTKKDVNRKINILRSNFKRELRRLRESKKDFSTTNLWYFDAISFIKDIKSTDDMGNSNNDEKKQETRSQKSKKATTTDNVVISPPRQIERKSSGFQKASEVWALKLQDMDFTQALIAEKLINDVIFFGLLNKLTMGTTVIDNNHPSTPTELMECCSDLVKIENTMDSV